MALLIRRSSNAPRPSEITPPEVYAQRRRFMQAGGLAVVGLSLGGFAGLARGALRIGEPEPSRFSTDETWTDYEDVTTYNNFYEFGTGKGDPARRAGSLQTEPWTIAVEGHCHKPGTYGVSDLVRSEALEERVYRLRCVEGWSMVIPWVGVPLGPVLRRLEPTGDAKFVEFTTLYDPEQMPGQRRQVLDWPYVEGLRMDEAMNPLTLLAVGLYGEVLPNQNGAPIRLVVPWKYGFKSIKSIVKIRFTETQPRTTWNDAAPNEYGFYANVNPNVDHPRWSQARERRIGKFFKQKTQMFNGYEEQVADLYRGMDLRRHF